MTNELIRLHRDPITLVVLRANDGHVRGIAAIDSADTDFVSQWKWLQHTSGYTMRYQQINKQSKIIYLHRALFGLIPGDGLEVDHINRNKWDNRRSNLRVVTSDQQKQNVSSRGGSSPYRGVTWQSQSGKWTARVNVRGQHFYLGCFASEVEAAEVARAGRLRLLPWAVD